MRHYPVPLAVLPFDYFFKQKTAYEIYQCDWSSDVCSSDLVPLRLVEVAPEYLADRAAEEVAQALDDPVRVELEIRVDRARLRLERPRRRLSSGEGGLVLGPARRERDGAPLRRLQVCPGPIDLAVRDPGTVARPMYRLQLPNRRPLPGLHLLPDRGNQLRLALEGDRVSGGDDGTAFANVLNPIPLHDHSSTKRS